MDELEQTEVIATPYSARLTEEGWENIEFIEPAADWRPMPDGSFISPDGTTRSWPPAAADEI